MLLLAAALFTASMHSLGVVEAPVAPAIPATLAAERSVDRDPVMTGGHRPVRTATDDAAREESAVRDRHGADLLDGLSSLSDAALRVAARDTTVQASVLDDPPSADDVVRWWADLPDADRSRLELDVPQYVGNLEGVPYAVRDTANRAYLATAARAASHSDSTTANESAMIGQIQASLVREPGAPEKQLLTVDLRGAGRVAIAIGDLQTASDVTVMVPGMFFTVTGQMQDWTATGGDIYAEQATLASSGSGGGVAVLAWMGYRTPDLSNIISLNLADSGADRLERVVNGLDTVRAVDLPRVTIVAHSYGSTTALTALSSGAMHADDLVLLGSPGSTVQHASQLAVSAGHVFVGDAHWDPVAGSGYFGIDPGSASFGSTLLDLAGGADAQDAGDVFRKPVGHNDYLKPGTASLHAVALIAIGRSDLVRKASDPSNPSGDSLSGSPDFLLIRPQDLQLRD